MHISEDLSAELKKQDVDWTPSRRWVRRFLGANGHSSKKPGVDALKEHGYCVYVVYIAFGVILHTRSVVERCTVIGWMRLSRSILLVCWRERERAKYLQLACGVMSFFVGGVVNERVVKLWPNMTD